MKELKELTGTLEKQKKVLEELLSLADEQLDILKEDDIERLQEITVRQEENGRELALLERKRREIVLLLSQKLNVEIEYLSDVYPHIAGEEKEVLQKLSEEIKEMHGRLKETTELNRILLKQGLNFAEKMINCLTGSSKNVYGKEGTLEKKSGSSIIDKSV